MHSRLLGKLLTGSWRREPPPLDISAEALAEVAPLLIGSGAAALVFRRLGTSRLVDSPPFEELQEASRLQVLQTAIHEMSVTLAVKAARAVGVEPILLKGWAVARLYPETWLRPSGDLDLLVPPDKRAAAEAALRAPNCGVLSVVDLHHDEFDSLDRSEWKALYRRSQVFSLEGESVRVLGQEDQFRFLCEHLWRHSAYRPLWLCDVAAALEACTSSFDWDQCLRGGERLTANRVGCAIGIARSFLRAKANAAPEKIRSATPPRWLTAEVLRQWESPRTDDHLPRELMAVSLRHPSRVVPALLSRWPDPIIAAVGTGTQFGERARLPTQLKFFLSRASCFLRRSTGAARALYRKSDRA